jgi:hypothetical protein
MASSTFDGEPGFITSTSYGGFSYTIYTSLGWGLDVAGMVA